MLVSKRVKILLLSLLVMIGRGTVLSDYSHELSGHRRRSTL